MKSALGLAVVAFLAMIVAVVNRSDAGVVAHWRFEEGPEGAVPSGTNSVLDSSVNNLHMSPHGNPTYLGVPNPGSDLGLDFDGDDGLSRPYTTHFVLTDLTVEAFIRYDDTSGYSQQEIFFLGDWRAGTDPIGLDVVDDRLRFYVDNIGDSLNGIALYSPNPLPTGQHVHVAGILNDATDEMKLFIDGAEVNSRSANGVRPITAPYPDAYVSIGGLRDRPSGFIGYFFDGAIDEVRISDVALDPSQLLVPEPSTFVLSALSLLTLLVWRWRRRR